MIICSIVLYVVRLHLLCSCWSIEKLCECQERQPSVCIIPTLLNDYKSTLIGAHFIISLVKR